MKKSNTSIMLPFNYKFKSHINPINMSIGPDARRWFAAKYGAGKGKVYTSKYYTAQQSWSKTPVWWFQIPEDIIDDNRNANVNLLCEVAQGKNDFHYIKVPTKFFQEHRSKFHKMPGKISIYLSAKPTQFFVEERGIGSLNFMQFLVHP